MREEMRHCTVREPVEDVWDYLADYRNVMVLAGGGCVARLERGAPGVAGATYSGCVPWEGLESRFNTKLVTAERPSTVAWSGEGSGTAASLRFELTPQDDDSTKVVATYELSLGRALVPIEPFAWALAQRLADRIMRRLHGLTINAQSLQLDSLDPIPSGLGQGDSA